MLKSKINIVGFITLLAIMILSSCNEEKKWVQAPINPNGDSELALIMRAMYEHSDEIKSEIKAGRLPDGIKVFEKIHSATATQPDKVNTELYKAMAETYLISVRTLKSSSADLYQSHFNAMVDNCMNCHQSVCPGPMVKIKKLYISED